MTQAKTTSVTLSPEMKDAISRLSARTYGVRGLSRWTEEQLRRLLQRRDFLVRYAQSSAVETGATKSVRLTEGAQELLTQGTLRVRKIDPLSPNVQSRLLRAAFAAAIEEAASDDAATTPRREAPEDQEEMEEVVQLIAAGDRPTLARRSRRAR